MMIQSLGRSPIKMGKELRMAQSSTPPQNQEQRVQEFVSEFNALRNEVRKVIVGHDEVINHVLTGLFAGGHVLLEGVPGLGKTLLIKTLAESLDLSFSRIQFTPDLMPGDIMGTNMIVEDESERKHFQFHRGPIFAHIVLATHPKWERSPEQTRRFVRSGASPRGAQALVLGAKVRALSEGRYNVSVEDLRAMALPSLRHRIILNFVGEAEAVDVDRLIGQSFEAAENMSATEKEVFLR
jgi:MoxR-like ATPase